MPEQNFSPLDTAALTDAATSVRYAGFWIRVAAVLIDGLALGLLGVVLGILLSTLALPGANVVGYLLSIVYSAAFHFAHGATPGKMVLNLRVVDLGGGAITLRQALVREVFSFLAVLISLPQAFAQHLVDVDAPAVVTGMVSVIGVLMGLLGLLLLIDGIWVLTNEKKQALHDIIAKTYCIRES